MSGEAKLQRSSWKAEAIRRGDLKISGPIPITEETPLNDEEEREYAERHNLTIESATPRPHSSPLQDAQAQEPQPPPQTQSSVNGASLHTASDRNEEQPQIQEEHHTLRHKRSSTAIRDTMHRDSIQPASYGSASPFPSIPDTPSKTTPKKKRKSGLRNVFRKMFGRRSREGHHEEEQDTFHKHSYHSSDPGLLAKSPERPKENVGGAGSRISDLPVREMEPINPLGQHLPFPMNVNAPQETSPPHDYLTFEVPHDLSRRRASLPSAHLSQAEALALSTAWNKQASSWDERQDADSIPSPQIGIALSSPTPPEMSKQVKRRSRSAGALRELAAKGRLSTERRRSAEIRYWRNSYQSGSVYSTNTPRPRTAQTVETVQTADTREPATRVPEKDVAELGEKNVQLKPHDQDLSQIELPVEAFNFGNLKSEFSDDEAQEHETEPELDVESEHADAHAYTHGHDQTDILPPPRSAPRLSIEERVKHLEDNMLTIEMSVRRLSGRSNRQTIILENAPKGRRSRNRSSSATSDREYRQSSLSRSSNKTLSIHHSHEEESGPASPTLAPLSAVDELEFPSSRDPRSEPLKSQSQSLSNSQLVSENADSRLTALYTALKNERAARKALEKQVIHLQREVQELNTLVHKFISGASPSYPTPSPDAIMASNDDRLNTPRASGRHPTGLGFGGGFEEREREALFRGDGSVASSIEDVDVQSPDVWATPKEDNSGFFARSRVDVVGKGDGVDEMF